MKPLNSNKKILLVTVLLLFSLSANLKAQQYADTCSSKHTIQINALEFMGRIYSVLYLYQFSPKNDLILGLAYQNQTNSYFGTTHAPSVIIGYRRYFWKGLNAEYSLWPAYNMLYEKNENKYYNGFELWGEFRAGYDVNFKVGKSRLSIMPQFILGKGLVTGNKPQSFKNYYKNEEHVFVAGNIALGVKF